MPPVGMGIPPPMGMPPMGMMPIPPPPPSGGDASSANGTN